ncbi:MAG TPA: glycosyltransferase family 4 protein, partial [Dehalococcoidia bacterium]
TPAHRWITRQALGRAGSITATGLRLAEATLPYTPQGKRVSVIPYGADLDLFRPQRRSSKATLTIGTVSRLSPEKGLDVLLRAVALIRERGTVLDVALAGDGPSRRGLEQLTERLGLRERVRFLGHVEHRDVPRVLQEADLFAVPSTWEGFGVSAVEASAMELPVVASNIHGLPDVVVDGETGLLVPPSDPGALAGAIERLAGDAELRATMGSAGRRYVERNYRWQDNVRLMESLYESVTSPDQ